MAEALQPEAGLLVGRLERMLALSAEERQALAELPMQVRTLRADQDVTRAGDRPARGFLLLEGFASSFKRTADGRRQIVALHVPGDLPDLPSLHLRTPDTGVGTITPCRVGFVYLDDLRALCARPAGLRDALWRAALVEDAVACERMLSLGRRNAHAPWPTCSASSCCDRGTRASSTTAPTASRSPRARRATSWA
ncbi:MAG TPA: Crp/Fnr family transcriptional regulator [Salinarimonas sp.]|nr:Crp/Fnr family transcriptional regulator [Salinarimonas sp.]